MIPRARPVAIASVGAAVLCACAHPDHPELQTSSGGEAQPCMVDLATGGAEAQAATYEWRMVPGVAAELDVDLGADGWMGAAFHSSGVALDWDIHTHEGDDVVVLDSGHDVSGFAELTAPHPGLYSFFWRNPGPADATLCVELSLTGDAALHPS
jgi:hypothetical protein